MPTHYLALGDSTSVDTYTGQAAGGAASQFAELIGATSFENRSVPGCTTEGALEILDLAFEPPDVVTVTVGGNDVLQLLLGHSQGEVQDWQGAISQSIARYDQIVERLRPLGCTVILNTAYDPTDGENELAVALGLPPEARPAYDRVNNHIRSLRGGSFIVSDLERLFNGHGFWSPEPWFVEHIEPNIAGATAIAQHWHALYMKAKS